jgi:glycosyltransferase involved in cell wall biosynthesis
VKFQNSSFLFIGRLSEEKGVTYLLNVFIKNGLHLRIGGDGPLAEETKKSCDKQANIQYLGNLSKHDVLQNMQECTALIFPSIWYEGMPITLIEAFSQGLPVIAGDLGAMASMIEDGYNGLLFKAGDSANLNTCIQKWQSYSEEQKEIFRQNARKTYEDLYTPEKNLIQLVNIYQSAIDAKAASLKS